MKGTGQRFGPI